ncbi:MAG: pyridoxamine 5'-phosphate oxidase family protein [Sphaerochaeta sp.]|uniref:pyridoxamine 5'-phosphate oxidase family protein n=1 Tax=Sphaerochaeta sp. TaxID=1972642 RepID=UPI003D0CEAB4
MAFRPMRRIRQMLSEQRIQEVLDRGRYGVLACLGDDGYPYAVPLNYVYFKNCIYFHAAKTGHKLDAISNHPKVSFTVVDQDTIVAEEYTSYFRSVILFGTAAIAEEPEWREAFPALVAKYCADIPAEQRQQTIDDCTQAVGIVVKIDHCTGKEAKELVRART